MGGVGWYSVFYVKTVLDGEGECLSAGVFRVRCFTDVDGLCQVVFSILFQMLREG